MATTILRTAVNSTITRLEVADTTGFAVNGGIVSIDSEHISYGTATDNQLINCVRGVDSTSPASHVVGDTVTFLSSTPHPDPDNGVDSIQADAGIPITGPVTLHSGTNISLVESGQGITVNSMGGTVPTPNIVQIFDQSFTTNNTATYVATSTAVTITPSVSTAKIRITVTGNIINPGGQAYFTIFKDGVNLASDQMAQQGANGYFNVPMQWLDAPGNTSPHTYKVYFRVPNADVTVQWGTGNSDSKVIIAEEIH